MAGSPGKTTGGRLTGKWLPLALVIALLLALMSVVPVAASNESSVGGTVEVIPLTPKTGYAETVVGSSHVIFPFLTTGEPDFRSAIMVHNGEISLWLSGELKAATSITVRGSCVAVPSQRVDVYVSADGEAWTAAGSCIIGHKLYASYTITGSFGEVRYIRLAREGKMQGMLLVDAVIVEGGMK